jgi:hypothetical protein
MYVRISLIAQPFLSQEGQWKPLNEKEDGRATRLGFIEFPCQLMC